MKLNNLAFKADTAPYTVSYNNRYTPPMPETAINDAFLLQASEQQKTAAGVNQDQYELKERQKTQDVIRIQSSISFCKGGMEKIMDSAGEGCQRQKKNKLCRFCFRIHHIFVAGCHIRASGSDVADSKNAPTKPIFCGNCGRMVYAPQ